MALSEVQVLNSLSAAEHLSVFSSKHAEVSQLQRSLVDVKRGMPPAQLEQLVAKHRILMLLCRALSNGMQLAIMMEDQGQQPSDEALHALINLATAFVSCAVRFTDHCQQGSAGSQPAEGPKTQLGEQVAETGTSVASPT